MANHASSAHAADEIDLFELAAALWAQKFLILFIVLVSTAGAASYAFLGKPVYEARIFTQPPTFNGIADFNYGRTKEAELVPYTISDVYSVFTRTLQSESLRRAFFTDVYLPTLSAEQRASSQDALYGDFLDTLSVGLPGKDQPDRYSVVVRGHDPAQAADWAKAFAARAGALAEQEMITNVTRESEVRARNLDQQITILQETEGKVRNDAITRLEEAQRVAQAIGLQNPPIITGNVSAEVSATMDGQLTYMRGTKALSAEIKNLKERTSDDPFIENLRSLQIKRSFFQSLQIRPENVSVYRQDGPVDVPDRPIKPKKVMIIAAGLVGGAVVGILVGLFQFFLARRMNHLKSALNRGV